MTAALLAQIIGATPNTVVAGALIYLAVSQRFMWREILEIKKRLEKR